MQGGKDTHMKQVINAELTSFNNIASHLDHAGDFIGVSSVCRMGSIVLDFSWSRHLPNLFVGYKHFIGLTALFCFFCERNVYKDV